MPTAKSYNKKEKLSFFMYLELNSSAYYNDTIHFKANLNLI